MSYPCPRAVRVAIACLPFLAAAPLRAALDYATPYVFTTLAGSDLPGSADGAGTNARFRSPWGLTVDQAGNVYVADLGNYTIRKITPAGAVSTIAGSPGVSAYLDGVGTAARFLNPVAITLDAQGNLFIGDDHLIRKVTPAGRVSTVAGVYNQASYHDGAVATATFWSIGGLVVDPTGVILVVDSRANTIRQIGLDQWVSTLAGSDVSYNTDGFGRAAGFTYPTSIAFAPDGSLIVADTGYLTIRRVTRAGAVTTVAGLSLKFADGSPSSDGPAATARFRSPGGAVVDANGNIFVADWGAGLIRKVVPGGNVTTLAGDPAQKPVGSRVAGDGMGPEATFEAPLSMAIDNQGTLYVTDGNRIRKGRLATGPGIINQPQNLTVTTGDPVQFSVTTTGAPDPTYQWYFNGAIFAGATSSTLSFAGARSADAGDYKVVVTNALGTVTSSTATLTVKAASTGGTGGPTGGSSGNGSTGGGGGGGGAPSIWFIVAAAALTGGRLLRPAGRNAKPAR